MPAIIRPRNADGSFGQAQKFGQGLTDKEKLAKVEAENSALAETNEALALALIDLDIQREADKAEMQTALIEIIEMGGI